MQCDYCDNTTQVSTLADRTGTAPDVHVCRDCWYAGVEPKLSEMLPRDAIADIAKRSVEAATRFEDAMTGHPTSNITVNASNDGKEIARVVRKVIADMMREQGKDKGQ